MRGDKVVAFRHGDLLITKIKEVEKNRYGIKKLNHLILAFGEATGHKHEITEGKAELFEANGVLYLKVESEEAELTHPEHNPIRIKKGAYLIEHQREYAPEQSYRRERRVLD